MEEAPGKNGIRNLKLEIRKIAEIAANVQDKGYRDYE
jgi:hypothetical protein